MSWNPSQVIEVNALAPDPNLVQRFVEREVVTTDARKGWAAPRKRPRRAYKKLAARGFAQRCNGPALDSSQYKRWEYTAPRLAAWLLHCADSEGWDTDTFHAKVAPMAYAPELGVLAVSESMARSHSLCFPRRPAPRVLEPIDVSKRPEPTSKLTLTGRKYCIECALYNRRLIASVVLYTENGNPPEALTRDIESHVADLMNALWQAAHGLYKAKRIAKQTSYRPTKETT